ncbi:MAG: hypothetical protein AAFQ14_03575, partial [Cyanobacteria bacterium J06621_12]
LFFLATMLYFTVSSFVLTEVTCSQDSNKVTVINSETNESREVNLIFIQDAARDSLSMLIQYKYYEVIINSKSIWRRVIQLETAAMLQKIESPKAASLVLKLKLEGDNNEVVVTNSQTNQSQIVTMRFIQEAAGDSLLMLVEYKYYELLINASKIWQKVQQFDYQAERRRVDEIERKFRDIMVNDQWMKITEHDKEMYNKALASWTANYNSQPHKQRFDKFVFIPTAGGALAGALTYNTIGGIGIAAAGTAFGVGASGFTALGMLGGLAAYGVGKAIG